MTPNRSLLRHAAIILLLSLAAGFVVVAPGVANPRMAVAAHIAGLLTAPLLLSLGLAWSFLELSERAAAQTERLLVVSLYANFAFVLLAALLGTSQAMPLAGKGHVGAPWAETFVSLGCTLAVVGLTVACVAIAVGFARGGRSENRDHAGTRTIAAADR